MKLLKFVLLFLSFLMFHFETSWGQSSDSIRYYYAEKGLPSDELRKDFDQLNIKYLVRSNIRYSITDYIWQGHKTDKVYVFLPGLCLTASYFDQQARNYFYEGQNVILGNLPGFTNQGAVAADAKAEKWLAYSIDLLRIAKKMGSEVIIVGQSLGAQMAVRMAEKKLVNGIVLIYPLLQKSRFKNLLSLDPLVNLVENSLPQYADFIESAKEANLIAGKNYRRISSDISVDIYLTNWDFVVFNSKAIYWADEFAPHSKVYLIQKEMSIKNHIFYDYRLYEKLKK